MNTDNSTVILFMLAGFAAVLWLLCFVTNPALDRLLVVASDAPDDPDVDMDELSERLIELTRSVRDLKAENGMLRLRITRLEPPFPRPIPGAASMPDWKYMPDASASGPRDAPDTAPAAFRSGLQDEKP
jgi:hypothetical protein